MLREGVVEEEDDDDDDEDELAVLDSSIVTLETLLLRGTSLKDGLDWWCMSPECSPWGSLLAVGLGGLKGLKGLIGGR